MTTRAVVAVVVWGAGVIVGVWIETMMMKVVVAVAVSDGVAVVAGLDAAAELRTFTGDLPKAEWPFQPHWCPKQFRPETGHEFGFGNLLSSPQNPSMGGLEFWVPWGEKTNECEGTGLSLVERRPVRLRDEASRNATRVERVVG